MDKTISSTTGDTNSQTDLMKYNVVDIPYVKPNYIACRVLGRLEWRSGQKTSLSAREILGSIPELDTVANGSPTLRCFVLPRRSDAEMSPASRYTLRRNKARITI